MANGGASRQESSENPDVRESPAVEASRAGSETRESLEIGDIVRLAVRTLPYLKGIRRDLRTLGIAALVLVPFAVFVGWLTTDLFTNRMLAGEPLTPFEAELLFVDPAQFVHVDALSGEARRVVRSRLLYWWVGSSVIGLPIGLALVFWFIRIAQRINQTLRTQMVSRVQEMSLRFHSGSRVGDSIYRTYQDSAMMTNLMTMLVRPIPRIFGGVLAIVLCLPFAWWLPLLLLACYAAQQQLGQRVTERLWRGFRESREKNSDLTSRIQETLSGIRVVKAFGTEQAEQERFERDSLEAFRAAFAARNRLAWVQIVSFTVTSLPLMVAAAVLAILAARGDATLAGGALAFTGFAMWNLGAYQAAMGRAQAGANAARGLVSMWSRTQDMTVGMNRAFAQVDLQPEVQNAEDAIPVPPFRDAVTFHNVSFAYQRDRPVLTGVDLRAEAGTITAIVGPTGSGKSTLVALLLRLFDPDSGEIEIDGADLRRFDLESLRQSISIALQENLLFGTSIRENIRYAVPTASDAQVRDAARIACADAFIEAQPEGYDTPLGERGAKLSTGQRQRLSIARAIIKDTPILVLDEPTASLDAGTELSVMRNLGEWGRGRAIFLITHRLSTIRRADQILYLRDGHVIESGSHDELMVRTDGAYRRFVELEESSRPEARPREAIA